MKNIVELTIVSNDNERLAKACDNILSKHLISGYSLTDTDSKFWKGGQILTSRCKVARCITVVGKVSAIEIELPGCVNIAGVKHVVYVDHDIDSWLEESLVKDLEQKGDVGG